jgi:predicted acylesterase/phospholipase RssA
VDAILRSAAIPLIFRPQADGAHLIVDGGLWESVPISLARERDPAPVVGVEIMPNKPTITEHGPIAWYLRGGASLMRARSAPPRSARRYLGLLLERLAEPATRVAPDIHIVPDLGLANPLNFSEVDSLEAAGYRAGMAALSALVSANPVETHG